MESKSENDDMECVNNVDVDVDVAVDVDVDVDDVAVSVDEVDSSQRCMWFRTLTRGMVQVPCSLTDTVLKVKERVHAQLGDEFAVEDVEFIFQGNIFRNEEPIAKYRVPVDAFVVLLVNNPNDDNPDMQRVLQIIKENKQREQAAKLQDKLPNNK